MRKEVKKLNKVQLMVIAALAVLIALSVCGNAQSVPIESRYQGGQLTDVPEYDWWYGCSPTSAGMLLGYYDRGGFTNFVPGGDAELSSWSGGGSPLANDMIASSGHIDDFYDGGYGASGDDDPAPHHSFDSLADFMGTSQDSLGNSNGATTFYYFMDGSPFHYTDAVTYSVSDSDGMYGIWEYIDYSGYDVDTLYTQLTDNMDLTYGFTLDDYIAEIDAGRPVMIQVENHSMLGYGYDDTDNSTVYLRDTWSSGVHTMPWGGSYPHGEDNLAMWGVTVLTVVPEPMSMVMLGCLGAGMFVARRMRRRKK